jgi:general transcription factor 3C polypeptide 3 (transcription factor C subunit 4)
MQRQANNRHHLILEAMTFLFRSRDLTFQKSRAYAGAQAASMRQEAEYNVARAFHQIGLLALAVRYYERGIGESEGVEGGLGRRDLVAECAHNLGLIYALSGNMAGVRAVTEKHLVL